jgi:hypothetical protein
VWLARFLSLAPAQLLAATLVVTGIVAAVSYAFVERPIRVDRRIARIDLSPKNLVYLVPAVSIVTALLVFFSLPDSTPDWARTTAGSEDVVVREATPPTTVPTGPATTDNGAPAVDSIALVGDSFMVSAYPGFRTVAQEAGITLVETAFAACPVGREPLANDDGSPHFKADECVASTESAYAWLMSNPVDTVIWHDLQSVLPRFEDAGEVFEPGTDEWTDDLLGEWTRTLEGFTGSGMEVVVLVPPLRSQDTDCSKAESERRCNDIAAQDRTIREATRAFEVSVGSMPGVRFVELDPLLCPGGVPCPARIDGVAVREGGTDQTHFTDEGALWFARHLIPMVAGPIPGLPSP